MPWFERKWSVIGVVYHLVPMPFSFKPVVHPLCIFRTALLGVEDPDVVDSVERGWVLGSPCLLKTGQCTVVHSLRVFKTALIDVEDPKVFDGVERGCVLRSPCLLITGH